MCCNSLSLSLPPPPPPPVCLSVCLSLSLSHLCSSVYIHLFLICNLHFHFPFQIVQVCGSLKVQLSPSKTTSSGEMEFIEPSVIGFIGECRVVESVASILEISIPYSTYTVTRTLDLKKIISVEAT